MKEIKRYLHLAGHSQDRKVAIMQSSQHQIQLIVRLGMEEQIVEYRFNPGTIHIIIIIMGTILNRVHRTFQKPLWLHLPIIVILRFTWQCHLFHLYRITTPIPRLPTTTITHSLQRPVAAHSVMPFMDILIQQQTKLTLNQRHTTNTHRQTMIACLPRHQLKHRWRLPPRLHRHRG